MSKISEKYQAPLYGKVNLKIGSFGYIQDSLGQSTGFKVDAIGNIRDAYSGNATGEIVKNGEVKNLAGIGSFPGIKLKSFFDF